MAERTPQETSAHCRSACAVVARGRAVSEKMWENRIDAARLVRVRGGAFSLRDDS
jgi:hypothetical protein